MVFGESLCAVPIDGQLLKLTVLGTNSVLSANRATSMAASCETFCERQVGCQELGTAKFGMFLGRRADILCGYNTIGPREMNYLTVLDSLPLFDVLHWWLVFRNAWWTDMRTCAVLAAPCQGLVTSCRSSGNLINKHRANSNIAPLRAREPPVTCSFAFCIAISVLDYPYLEQTRYIRPSYLTSAIARPRWRPYLLSAPRRNTDPPSPPNHHLHSKIKPIERIAFRAIR